MLTTLISSSRFAAALLAAAAGLPAFGQGANTIVHPAERLLADPASGSAEHFSIAQIGAGAFPTGYVSVGRLELPGVGTALHLITYDQDSTPIPGGEVYFTPPLTQSMAGFSVEVAANGDFLVAGVIQDDYSGSGDHNVFVSRIAPDFSVQWTTLLPGTQTDWPSVVARELADGGVIISHNTYEIFGPILGRATHLTHEGRFVWSREYHIASDPAAAIQFSDIRQTPDDPNLLIAAGWYSSGLSGEEATVYSIDVRTGDCVGEGGWRYPHPDYFYSRFTGIAFDTHPDSSVTMVVSGHVGSLDFGDPPRPRVVDLATFGGGPNWDVVYDVPMIPAPTAVTVKRLGYPHSPAIINVAGSNFGAEARSIGFKDTALGSASVSTFGQGVSPSARVNDMTANLTMIGGRDHTPGLSDVYYIVQGFSDCTTYMTAPNLGAGDVDYIYPNCDLVFTYEQIPLRTFSRQSADAVICTWESSIDPGGGLSGN